jgi:hypothetical protein
MEMKIYEDALRFFEKQKSIDEEQALCILARDNLLAMSGDYEEFNGEHIVGEIMIMEARVAK